MERGFNGKQKLVVVVMDVLLLVELTCSILLGHRDPENMTAIFLRTFLPLVLGTLIISRICVRKLGSPKASPGDLTA